MEVFLSDSNQPRSTNSIARADTLNKPNHQMLIDILSDLRSNATMHWIYDYTVASKLRYHLIPFGSARMASGRSHPRIPPRESRTNIQHPPAQQITSA